MAELIRSLSPQQRTIFLRKYQKTTVGLVGPPRNQLTPRPLGPMLTRAAQKPTVVTAPASRKLARDKAEASALCTALSGNLPGIPDGCKGIDITPP
jgi:hypothetical protein